MNFGTARLVFTVQFLTLSKSRKESQDVSVENGESCSYNPDFGTWGTDFEARLGFGFDRSLPWVPFGIRGLR